MSAAEAAREAARKRSGKFGNQENTGPEEGLPAMTAREQRLVELNDRFAVAKAEWDAASAALLSEHVAAAWEAAPAEAATIRFHDHRYEGLSFSGVLDERGAWIPAPWQPYREIADWADQENLGAGLERDHGYVVLRVGKEATRRRIAALREQWEASDSTAEQDRAAEEIALAVTRYLNQLSEDEDTEAQWAASQLVSPHGHTAEA